MDQFWTSSISQVLGPKTRVKKSLASSTVPSNEGLLSLRTLRAARFLEMRYRLCSLRASIGLYLTGRLLELTGLADGRFWRRGTGWFLRN